MTSLYGEHADWFHLLTRPEDYAEEAEFFHGLFVEACSVTPQTMLELGSGGGNNASHLKARYALTLVDVSPQMLAVSRSLNPECEHVEGDMRSVRLGRTFDSVFVHDAIEYMTNEADLEAAMLTAFEHCRSGGAALFAPDHVRETFREGTETGGHDGDGRSLRYLEWTFDPDPTDSTYLVDFAVLLREGAAATRVVYDRHTCGLLGRADWLRLLHEVGFEARTVLDPWGRDVFVAKRRP
jgi:SAM-dependent methyltransferase